MKNVGWAGRVRRAIRLAQADTHSPQHVLPGHYASPIPSLREVRADQERIFDRTCRHIPGIDLRESEQMALMEQFVGHYRQMPFAAGTVPGSRYHLDNDFFTHMDGVILFCMLMHLKPRRVVEIGSGYSSRAMLDTSGRFLGGATEFVFVEPEPGRLLSLLSPEEAASLRVVRDRVQNVPLGLFDTLGENDILFIDSSHVAKVGSDVNHLLFRVLPRVRRGVYVHFHDVFFPFEYPESWIYEGRALNEAYMLRAFLQYNVAFEVVVMNGFIQQFHEAWLRQNMPACVQGTGTSLWLRKR